MERREFQHLCRHVSSDLSKPPLGLSAPFTSGTLAGDHGVGAPLLLTQDGLCNFGGVRSLDVPFGIAVFTY